MRARVRHRPSFQGTFLTAIALVVLATARLPDLPHTGPATIHAVRVAEPAADASRGRAGLAVRIGLATLLLAGLVLRLRTGD